MNDVRTVHGARAPCIFHAHELLESEKGGKDEHKNREIEGNH